MLSAEELFELEEDLIDELDEKLTGALCKLNRIGQLEKLLKMLDCENLLKTEDKFNCFKNGNIVVIGQSEVKDNVILMTASKLGISKDRLELYTDYNDGKKFDIKKLQYNSKYSAIMVGPMGHSGIGKGDFGSVISAMENEPGYPPVIKLGGDSLKITKSNFKNTLKEMIENNIIEL